MPKKIDRIIYTKEYFSPVHLRIMRCWVYEADSAGRIVESSYYDNQPEPESRREYSADPARFDALCMELDACIAAADREIQFVDDCGAELEIFRDGAMEAYQRGHGTKSRTVGDIVEGYLQRSRR